MRKIKADLHSNMPFVGMRMPSNVLDYVEKLGRKTLRTKSDIMRSLIVEALVARGIVELSGDLDADAA